VRLLFDEQLSEDLVSLLGDVFPDSLHVRQIGSGGTPDGTVWELARERECLLVTKDEDFHRLSIVRGAPPKVIWVNRRELGMHS
jgi:predicted nuclease of predicted toxin-antitoxin system